MYKDFFLNCIFQLQQNPFNSNSYFKILLHLKYICGPVFGNESSSG